MIIDPIDLKLIRQLELHGSVSLLDFIGKFHITTEEVLLRIKNFEETGFITGYGVKMFIPALLGGKWYRACLFAEADGPVTPEKSIPYLEEMIFNQVYPRGAAPDLSLLFYTQDLKNSYRTANHLPGIKYCELYKIGEYKSGPPLMLLRNDWNAIATLFKGKLNYARIHRLLHENESETDVRLSQLVWHKKNRRGVVSIYPNFNWSVIKNFAHVHFAVAGRMRVKELRKYLLDTGLTGTITSRFKKCYLQVEFDIWGFSDLQAIVPALSIPRRLAIEACSFAHRNVVYDEWLPRLISEQKL